MSSKLIPSRPGAPSLALASRYATLRVSALVTWTYRPQNRHVFSAFALRYIFRLSSCRSTKGFIIPCLPHLSVERINLSMAPLLHLHYQTSSLLRATPSSCLPSVLFPCPQL